MRRSACRQHRVWTAESEAGAENPCHFCGRPKTVWFLHWGERLVIPVGINHLICAIQSCFRPNLSLLSDLRSGLQTVLSSMPSI